MPRSDSMMPRNGVQTLNRSWLVATFAEGDFVVVSKCLRDAWFISWATIWVWLCLVVVPDLRAAAPISKSDPVTPAFLKDRVDWWSLAPVVKSDVPDVHERSWSDHPIDCFVLSKLEAAGLKPVGMADPQTLVRRLTILLTGIPPTSVEVKSFCAEAESDWEAAYGQLVERLLESPHFGERWARHWMDVVRFAETYGYEWNFQVQEAWRYRDYLIRAFNADLPYDQFVREQLAGDLLPEPRINPELGVNESMIGTAFYRFAETGHDDGVSFPAIRFDPLDNQIDTMSKAFQASTVACARCHDHKLDAISTVDYYALAGILESSRQVVHTIDLPDRFAEPMAAMRILKRDIRREVSAVWLGQLEEVAQHLQGILANPESDENVPTQDNEVEGQEEAGLLRKQVTQDDELTRENPGFVLQHLIKLTASDEQDLDVSTAWQDLSDRYQRDQEQVKRFNSENFHPWTDFQELRDPDWKASGLGLTGNLPTPAGEFAVSHDGDEALSMILPAGWYTHLMSDKLNGAIQSPRLPKDFKYVSLRFLAGGLAVARSVLDSCVLGEYGEGGLRYFAEPTEGWSRYPTGKPLHHHYLELATKSVNPRWPERFGIEASFDSELSASPRSWFGVVKAVVHDCEEKPQEELGHMVRLLASHQPSNNQEVAQAYAFVLRGAIEAFRDQEATDVDVRWIHWARETKLLHSATTKDARLAKLIEQYRHYDEQITPPRVVAGMADHNAGFDFPVLQAGDPHSPGAVASRGYLQVFADSDNLRVTEISGSGRLELANLIAHEDNPLTARVMVNRVWHHLFGSGIVSTPDDFGRMGEPPSHPELLDFLANEFIDSGWSVKQLIRTMVTSRTFQQQSRPSPESQLQDTGNRLLHHYPVFRLDAETVRDSILAVSGRLDRTQFGPSIPPYRTKAKPHRKLEAGPLDGDGRRSVYIKVTRMEGNQFMELFDRPDPLSTRGRRDRTNVPAQALSLLNDPFLIEQSLFWANQLVQREEVAVAERVAWMYLKSFGRYPDSQEQDRMEAFVGRLQQLHQVEDGDLMQSLVVWKDVCHAMFNSKELLYVW